MGEHPPVRFLYRYVPLDRICTWGGTALVLVAAGTWMGVKSGDWRVSGVLFAMALFAVVRLGFFRTRVLLVNDDGLSIIKRPLIGGFGSYDFFQGDQVRLVRYRLEIRQHSDSESDWEEKLYLLEIITTDARIVPVIVSTGEALPADLGRKFAGALRCRYEEYLEERPA